jgi:hypothetical protein
VLLALAAALAIPGAALAATLIGPQTPMHVITHPVGPRTAVVVKFLQPVDTTSMSSLETTERLEVAGPTHSGCIGQSGVVVPAAQAGSSMTVTVRPVTLTLRPDRPGGLWCLGTYRGTLIVSMMPRCGGQPIHACPEFVVAPRTVGHFSFRVTPR